MRQLELFPKTLSKKKLPTNLTANNHPIHRWFNFTAGFSPEFVKTCIQEADLQKTQVLVEPFAGFSTSLVQANFEQIKSVGFETHPFFFDISQAKIIPPQQTSAVDIIENTIANLVPYEGELNDIWSNSAVKFLNKLVPSEELRSLAQALLVEKQINSNLRPLYRLILSRVLESTSGSQTDGIYKAPTTKKKVIPYQSALKTTCREIRSDIEAVKGVISNQAILYPVNSEKMSPLDDRSCSICVTSPPYLNNFDFAEMTRMELYFWRYAGSWSEITENIRRRLIVNTTTAPTDLKKNQQEFKATLSKKMLSYLTPLVEALKEQKELRAGKKDYYLLIYPYFSQMQSVFRELRRVLKPNSMFHLVIADSALYGVHIETHNLLAELMREVGFDVLDIKHLRKRGDRWILKKRTGAKKGLGEYHIVSKRI